MHSGSGDQAKMDGRFLDRGRFGSLLNAILGVVVLSALVLPAYAQQAEPSGGTTVTHSVFVPIPPQPIYGAVQPIVNEQQSLIPQLFCVPAGQTTLWALNLDDSPFVGTEIPASASEGIGTWTPRVVSHYDWIEGYVSGDLSWDDFVELLSSDADAAIMIGELHGTCDSAWIVALGLRRTVDSQVVNYLIPVMEVSGEVIDVVDLLPPDPVVRAAISNCDTCDFGCCDQ